MPNQIGARADRAIGRIRAVHGDVLLFSSGHFLRVFAARWLGLEPAAGQYFLLGTASLSVLGYEHNNRSEPVIRSVSLKRARPMSSCQQKRQAWSAAS